ncbi:MAG: hypothetical protein KDK37_19415, partial [Leptospiraceae bacterium]|nr:hypothetical protein [Leptospiraceae bacterium]
MSGDFSSALESSKKAWGFQSGVFGMAVVPELNFFESLSLAGMARHTKNRWIGHRAITRIKRNQRKMKVWARHCPENYECKHSLVQAELAALQGRHSEAIERYNDSIRSATQNQFRLENALANRLCAQFFLTSGMARVAESYLREAHYSFQRFGISYLSRQLEEEFPVLFGRHRNIGSLTVTGEQTYTGDSLAREGSNPEDLPTANQFLDLRTVLRCTQAISGEIFLDQLIEKLMSQVIENAGAERCYLFLPGKEDLLLAAAVDVTG